MAHRQDSRIDRIDAQRRRAAEALKRCPLCDAINARSNEECFVCNWHGAFDHDPVHVEAGLDELLDRCPELANAMMEPPEEQVPPARFSAWNVLCGAFRRFFRHQFFGRRTTVE